MGWGWGGLSLERVGEVLTKLLNVRAAPHPTTSLGGVRTVENPENRCVRADLTWQDRLRTGEASRVHSTVSVIDELDILFGYQILAFICC